ncbi:membrane protein [hydrothermal vent metagenome]|uniref:Membrane protein n=1 Tax=hydrothermal vent metagenome TaxID=652676 RepID=A0A1W1B9M0_9ZZZZ
MKQARVGFALLVLLLSSLLNATHFIKNDLTNSKASNIIEDIGNELSSKTGVYAYVVATNEKFPVGFNLVEYSKRYDSNMSKPFVLLIFAPNALITTKSEASGRVGVITSSPDIKKMYDVNDVKDATIDVVAAKDKNSKKDKYTIGIVQGYSELADQIASSKGVKMTKTIPNETKVIIKYLKYLVFLGSAMVLWIFVIRPIVVRIRYGKK